MSAIKEKLQSNGRKVALITGTASGIGFETAKRFARDTNYQVYPTDQKTDVIRLFSSHNETTSNVTPLELDVRNPLQIAAVTSQILDAHGQVDVLVNNAGILITGKWDTFFYDGHPRPELRDIFETNLLGPTLLMRSVLGYMKEGSSIINISSAKHRCRDPFSTVYSDYKVVLAGASHILAKKLSPHVRVIDVQPG